MEQLLQNTWLADVGYLGALRFTLTGVKQVYESLLENEHVDPQNYWHYNSSDDSHHGFLGYQAHELDYY